MGTAEKVNQESKRRSKKEDAPTPLGTHIAEEAKAARERKVLNPIVETFYEMSGNKLILCKRRKSGTVYKTLIGSTVVNDKASGLEKTSAQNTKAFAEKLQKENKFCRTFSWWRIENFFKRSRRRFDKYASGGTN